MEFYRLRWSELGTAHLLDCLPTKLLAVRESQCVGACNKMLLSVVLAMLACSSAAHQPHVLFVVVDDLGWDDVGFRSHQVRTPIIDALAADGIVLNQYYVQDVCSPSRATFMTGRYPLHHTVNDWLRSGVAMALPLNETTMAQRFREAGYHTHGTYLLRPLSVLVPPSDTHLLLSSCLATHSDR